MNTQTPFVIISPDKEGLNQINTQVRRAAMREQLNAKRLPFVPVRGVYKGQSEAAFLVLTRRPEAVKTLESLARAYGQESILVVDANRHAALHTPDGDITPLGRFRAVSEAEAKQADAYTESDGQFYIAG